MRAEYLQPTTAKLKPVFFMRGDLPVIAAAYLILQSSLPGRDLFGGSFTESRKNVRQQKESS